MMKLWRPLMLAAALDVTLGLALAAAQTVVVRQAPEGSAVEFVLNTAIVGTATVNAEGDATVTAKPATAKPEMDAYLYVDVCDKRYRVLIVERGTLPPPADTGCDRRQISGLFLVRPVSTLVINVSRTVPTVLLRQGVVDLRAPVQGRTWSPSATGLVIFGGGGVGRTSDFVALACGDVSECSGGGFRPTLTGGATFWFTPFIGVEASYLKPAKFEVTGSGTGFRFTSELDVHVVNLVGKVGVPVGRARIYGQGGATYHRGASITEQTSDATTVTIDGVATTIPGGTQTFELQTDGWGWTYGGGLELWLRPSFALYGEFGRSVIKGSALENADGSLDDNLTVFMAGARIRIGR
jgi:hypothetical protein